MRQHVVADGAQLAAALENREVDIVVTSHLDLTALPVFSSLEGNASLVNIVAPTRSLLVCRRPPLLQAVHGHGSSMRRGVGCFPSVLLAYSNKRNIFVSSM
jgi:hypothetical protein